MQCRIEYFDVGVSLDIAGSHFASPVLGDRQCLGLVAVQLERYLLQIQDHVGSIFDDAFNRREFVLDTFDFHRRNCRSFDRRKQRASQRVADRRAESALERLC